MATLEDAETLAAALSLLGVYVTVRSAALQRRGGAWFSNIAAIYSGLLGHLFVSSGCVWARTFECHLLRLILRIEPQPLRPLNKWSISSSSVCRRASVNALLGC